jgi:hypothetical protein
MFSWFAAEVRCFPAFVPKFLVAVGVDQHHMLFVGIFFKGRRILPYLQSAAAGTMKYKYQGRPGARTGRLTKMKCPLISIHQDGVSEQLAMAAEPGEKQVRNKLIFCIPLLLQKRIWFRLH